MRINKDSWIAAEKNRKEKWVHDKEREIRDEALRNFEPELVRIKD